MVLTKLQEALAEIVAQRQALDDVEVQLRSMIAKFNGSNGIAAMPAQSVQVPLTQTANGKRDKIDEVADVIRAAGKLSTTAVRTSPPRSKMPMTAVLSTAPLPVIHPPRRFRKTSDLTVCPTTHRAP